MCFPHWIPSDLVSSAWVSGTCPKLPPSACVFPNSLRGTWYHLFVFVTLAWNSPSAFSLTEVDPPPKKKRGPRLDPGETVAVLAGAFIRGKGRGSLCGNGKWRLRQP